MRSHARIVTCINVCFSVFSAIRIELYGIALVKWDGDTEDQFDPDEKVKGDCNREQYFHKKISLLERGKYILLSTTELGDK